MNTGKQINAMIALMLLLLLLVGLYTIYDPFRAEATNERTREEIMERAAHTYARNCRQCHGNEGEGRIGPALNPAFRSNNANLRNYTDEASRTENQQIVTDTLQCGRIGTVMPPWAQAQGGGLIDEQIRQLMLLIVNPTEHAWDHVAEISAEEEETVPLPPVEEVLSGAAVTGATSYVCGQRAPEQPADTGPVEVRQQWEVVATDNRFNVTRMGVAANQSATVTLQNRGNALHNWVVQNVRSTNGQAIETPLIPGGQTSTVTFTIATPGTYPFLCTVHPAEMRGNLVVE
jgi:plastocyanin/mono/diheme cytochrome c family protein